MPTLYIATYSKCGGKIQYTTITNDITPAENETLIGYREATPKEIATIQEPIYVFPQLTF